MEKVSTTLLVGLDSWSYLVQILFIDQVYWLGNFEFFWFAQAACVINIFDTVIQYQQFILLDSLLNESNTTLVLKPT
jgi:hypothetical protein